MAKNCKYQKYQKYVSYDNGATWQPLQEFQKGELIEASSTDCGGGTVVYQWVVDSYYCNNSDRYATEKKQVSYNNGQSWEDVVPSETKSTLVEKNSSYCGSYQYRWYPSGTTCIGYNLWQNNIRQVSRDGGQTWVNVSPAEYSASTVIEYNSEDCGYVPPTPPPVPSSAKWVAIYSDSHIESAECDSSSAITYGEINLEDLVSVEISDCVTSIEHWVFNGCGSLTSVTIGNNVQTIGVMAFSHCTSLTDVIIPNSVTSIGEAAFHSCYGLRSVTIGSGVTTIGENVFFECSGLTSVTIPDSVTSIPFETFFGCTSLSSVTIGSGVTTIGGAAFGDCTSLQSITIPNSVTSIGAGAFWHCSGLTSVTIPNSVITIPHTAFVGCGSLTSITIPNSVTSIGSWAFQGCSSLTSVTIPNSVTSISDRAFSGCTSLTSVTVEATIPPTIEERAFDNTNDCPIYVPCASVDAYKSAWSEYSYRIQGIPPCGEPPTPTGSTKWVATYSGGTTSSAECDSSSAITSGEIDLSGLTSVTINDCVTTIGNNAFYLCRSLSSVTMPNSVTTIGTYAFQECAFSSFIIPESVTVINDSAFYGCTSLTSITIPSGVTSINFQAFVLCTRLSSVTIPNSVTSIGGRAFQSCTRLPSIIIPNSVTSIGDNAFTSCYSLDSVTILAQTPPTLGNSVFDGTDEDLVIYVPCASVGAYKSASGWSTYAYRIQGIPPCGEPSIIYRWYPSGTTCIGYDKYQNNIKQQSTDGGETWTNVSPLEYSASTVIEYNSEDCGYVPPTPSSPKWVATYNDGGTITTSSAECDSSSAITQNEITYKKLVDVQINDCVTSIGYHAFYYYTSLTSITIPNSVTSISTGAFEWCEALTSVTIPNSVTSIGSYAFQGCSGLTSINIPNSITSISNGTFSGCTRLTSVTIPDSVTSIGNEAFYKCSGLTSITIPSGVTSIGTNAFNSCEGLISITCLATTPPTLDGTYVFSNTNNCLIYVPTASVDIYKAASGWSKYADRIQCIPPTPSFDGKWLATYIGGTTSSAQCDSSSAITSGEISTHSAVTSVQIGDCVTSINDYGLAYCRNLSSITIPNNVTSIGNYALQQCFGLTSLSIGSGVTTIGNRAFNQCTSLTSVTIPDSVTSIGEAAFNYCSGLTSANISSSISSISTSAFSLCYHLEEVTIPNSVTSISQSAFNGCRSLTSVTIPSSVTSIGIAAFNGCSGLTSITIEATTPPILNYNTFNNTNNCPIYVPAESVSAYKSAWSSLASRIQAIPNS